MSEMQHTTVMDEVEQLRQVLGCRPEVAAADVLQHARRTIETLTQALDRTATTDHTPRTP